MSVSRFGVSLEEELLKALDGYVKGWIDNPRSKALSLHLTEEGFKKSEQLFFKYFGQEEK